MNGDYIVRDVVGNEICRITYDENGNVAFRVPLTQTVVVSTSIDAIFFCLPSTPGS